MTFATCRRCSHPFPVLVEGSVETRCPPCRKRERGEALTKSDVAFDEVHGFYTQREAGWRARLDAVESSGTGNLDEVERLRARCRALSDDLDDARAELATSRRGGHDAELLRRQVRSLTTEIENLRRRVADLERENARLQLQVRAGAFQGLFGRGPQDHLDREFLTDLLKLCHPDRYATSGNPEMMALANTATAKLLNMRRSAR